MKRLIIVALCTAACCGGAAAQGTEKSQIFEQQDPAGIAMAITAMTVVFSALILLYFFFRTLGKIMTRKPAVPKTADTPTAVVTATEQFNGEVIAAVALALALYEEDLHDIESNVVTINKVARAYSPWSSKIYTLRQVPQRR